MSAKKHISERRHRRLAFEHCEDRLVLAGAYLSGGTLVITGTNGPDQVSVNQSGSTVVATVNGSQYGFPASSVSSIAASLRRGSDRMEIGQELFVPSRIAAGAGNDTILGGGGPDTVYGDGGGDFIDGRGGADRLYGQGGADTLRGGPDADTLDGGRNPNSAAVDTIYACMGRDSLATETSPWPDVVLTDDTDTSCVSSGHYQLSGGSPFQTQSAFSTQPGERTALDWTIFAPSGNSVTVYAVTVSGDMRGGSNFRLLRSQPGSGNIDVFASSSMLSNSDGSKTFVLAAPVTIPAGSTMSFQTRFDLSSSGLPVDLWLSSVEVSGVNASLNWTTRIRWNA